MPSGIYKRIKPAWNKGLLGFSKGRKHTEETKRKISEINKGRKNPHTDEHRKKIGLANRGKIRSESTKQKLRIINLGKKLSKETILKYRECQRGEKHWRWNGGFGNINFRIRQTWEYRQWKNDVFTRDDFTCQDCGIRGGDLHAHHIKEFNIILKENNIKTIEEAQKCSELWNINNGKTLHKNCHSKYHLQGKQKPPKKHKMKYGI